MPINALGGYELAVPDGDYMIRKLSSGRPAEYRLLKLVAALAKGGLVVDIGAHIGNHTVYWARSGCHVRAFEPNPEARSWLRDNVQRNGIGDLVEISSTGLWSANTHGVLRAGPAGHLGKTRVEALELGQIELRTLDSFSLHPSVIKIDVEGAELEVLKGAETTLKDHRPALLVEAHSNRQHIEDVLRPVGYRRWGGFWADSPTFLYVASKEHRRHALPKVLGGLPWAARVQAGKVKARLRAT